MFYPHDPAELRATIGELLSPWRDPVRRRAAQDKAAAPLPKALVVPHAGYRFSGPVAVCAFAQLLSAGGRIRRVVLLGPSHHYAFDGLAATGMAAYLTSLGLVHVDEQAVALILDCPGVRVYEAAHGPEHSLEVELPFLQVVLGEFSLVPLVTGIAGPGQVADVLETVWGGEETLIVISTDLSHFHPYGEARRIDAATCRAVETLDESVLNGDRACGHVALSGLLVAARRHGLSVRTLDLRNSGDTSGDRDRVVGYGAWGFYCA